MNYYSDIYYKRDPTGNIGVEETTAGDQGAGVRIMAKPNPFVSFTIVPGHENEHFSIYDVSGKYVGDCRGDRVAEGLAPGVYFLGAEGGTTKPVRIVKIK